MLLILLRSFFNEVKMDKKRFGALINLMINIIVGCVLTAFALLSSQTLSLVVFLQNVTISICAGYLIGDWLPVMDIGQSVARATGFEKGLLNYLVSTLVLSITMIVIISFFCTFVQAGSAVFIAWINALPKLLLVGTIAIELTLWFIVKVAAKITGVSLKVEN